MNFLGMGPAELVLIMIIALIVLGPGKLPEVARALGKTMREFRSLTDGFQTELRKELDSASNPVKEDLKSIKKTLDVTADSAKEQAKAVSSTIAAIPDDSFTVDYQKAQGGGGEANITTPDVNDKGPEETATAQTEEVEEPISVADENQPVEYAPTASGPEGPGQTG
jgi:sec-independent protein translocase protein TatA